MVFASRTEADTLLVGERDYAVRDRRQTYELDPQVHQLQYPYGNSLRIHSPYRIDMETFEIEMNPDLVFKPEFGGARLPSHETYLPTGFSGSSAELVVELARNAGQLDFTLPDEDSQVDLGSNPHSDALLASFRHEFGPALEAYVDALVLSSHGETRGDTSQGIASVGDTGYAYIDPASPVNPFTETIVVGYPLEPTDNRIAKRFETSRYTAGLAARLPRDWRAAVEMDAGAVDSRARLSLEGRQVPLLFLSGDPSDLDTNPFGGWDTFLRALGVEIYRTTISQDIDSKFRDVSVRLAGPVFSTAAGPATLTMLAERFTDQVPGYTEVISRTIEGITTTTETATASRSRNTTSFHAELRSRIFGDAAPRAVRALELQLAMRHDEEENVFAEDPRDEDTEFVHARFAGTTYTAGAKVSPTTWLTLRGSYATGEQPPSLSWLNEFDPVMSTTAYAEDPKRGGAPLGSEGAFLYKGGGNADLTTTRASTTYLGVVLTPGGMDGPRFAIDLSRIRRTRDVTTLGGQEIIDNEDAWPGRVERAPLTDSDRADGFSAGRVTMFDGRSSNDATLEVEAIDLHADWPLRFLGGRLRLYAEATYHKRNALRVPFQAEDNRAGYFMGPLKRRANGGFDWSRDRITLGANLQYFGSYSVLAQGTLGELANELNLLYQGARRIPSQSYLDLHASWRAPMRNFGPLEELSVDFGFLNVLDETPPRESPVAFSGPGYSRYGDPRQRRFELALSARF
jgi:hypothetical protein